MSIDDLDRHRVAAGSLERAAVPLGMYLAWCGNLHLLSAEFQAAHDGLLTRLRYRDVSPVEFLTASTGGSLDAEDLNEEGRAFTTHYYRDYLADLTRLFSEDEHAEGEATVVGGVYDISNDWPAYDRIAAMLTRRLMNWKQGGRRGSGSSAGGTGRKWWQVWR